MESEPMLTPREKSPPQAGQPAQHTTHWAIEDHITQDSQPNTLPTDLLRTTSHRTASPTHYPLSYWGPHHTGQPAQHTTHWPIEDHITQDSQPNTLPTDLLRTTSHRTASPTHYPLSYWGPHHTGQPAQHTTHWPIEDHITQDSQPNTLPTDLLRTAASGRTASPTHYPLSYWGLHHTGQPAQHTTHWAIEDRCIRQDSQPNTLPTELLRIAVSGRTASPTHYPLSYWGPHHTGQPAQHTTHWAIEDRCIRQDSQPNTLPTELLQSQCVANRNRSSPQSNPYKRHQQEFSHFHQLSDTTFVDFAPCSNDSKHGWYTSAWHVQGNQPSCTSLTRSLYVCTKGGRGEGRCKPWLLQSRNQGPV